MIMIDSTDVESAFELMCTLNVLLMFSGCKNRKLSSNKQIL